MNLKRPFILLFVLTAVLIGLQDSSAQNLRYIGNDVYFGDYTPIKRQLTYSDVEGSPYLNKELTRGLVLFSNGDSVTYYLRYDIYSDEMEYLQNKSLFVILNIEKLDHILLNGDKMVYKSYFIKSNLQSGYLIHSLDSYCNLYQKPQIRFEPDKPAKSSYDEDVPAHFKEKPTFWFYSCGSDAITHFSADNSGLKQISGPHYDALKAFMKKNKLKLKNEADLVALFKHYSVLLQE